MNRIELPYEAQNEKPPWEEDAFDTPLLCAEEIDALDFSEMGPVITIPDPFKPGVRKLCPNPYFNGIETLGSFKEYLMGHYSIDYKDYLRKLLDSGRLPIGKTGSVIAVPER